MVPIRNTSDFITHALRIVVPMRREFGRSVNVQAMLDEPGYARDVITLAMSSTNPQVRTEAEHLQALLAAPRPAAAQPATRARAG